MRNFTESLRNASSVDEFMDIIDRADSEKKILMRDWQIPKFQKEHRLRCLQLLPVRPVSHTPIWQQKELKKQQKQRTVFKIETRGSGGAKNVLTDQEIAEADCIIVAADAKVPMDRFDGKKVIECQVSDGISKADQLVDRAINGMLYTTQQTVQKYKDCCR